jgi:hypothetical protein
MERCGRSAIHIGVMPAAFITRAHFSTSVAMRLKSVGGNSQRQTRAISWSARRAPRRGITNDRRQET